MTGSRGVRGQSTVLGVVLLVGLSVASLGIIVGVGSDALDASSNQMEIQSAEHAFMELDSKITLVAHGGSTSQQVTLPKGDGTTLQVEESAGWMNVTVVNQTSGEVDTVVANETLGAIIYENGDTEIAYQNGGVWRYQGNGSVMVSPPEVHYRGTTLTLPMVRAQRDGSLSRSAVIKQSSSTVGIYPTPGRENPLTEGQVNITVHSKYYRAWAEYFEERTTGNVAVDHQNQTVTLGLVVMFSGGYQNAVATTSPGGITVNGNNPPPQPYDTGVSYPSADPRIEDRIDDCETNTSNCNTSATSTFTAGKPYFINNSDYSGNADFDTSGGNVTLIVDGDVTFGNVETSGGNKVSILVREDFTIDADEVNNPGDPERFSVAVHSDGDVDFNGNYKYIGFLYAPGSDCDINGGGSHSPNLVGGAICDTMDLNGDPNDFEYDEDIDDVDMNLESNNTVYITYLHVSRTNVTLGS